MINTSSAWLPVVLLAGGILPLLAGPLLARWAERSEATKGATDAFVAVSMTGIVVLHIWPHAFLTAGIWTLVGGVAGLMTPFLLHGPFSHREQKIYPALVAVAFFGLAIHATLDGVALFTPLVDHLPSPAVEQGGGGEIVSHEHARESSVLLALAVILHRLPMGLAVWWLTVPILGRRVAIGILAVISGATVLGFQLAGSVLVDLSLPAIAIFEATIAGMLLHVVAGHEHGHHDEEGHGHHHHGHGHHHHGHHHHGPVEDRAPWGSALGAILGLALIVGLFSIHPVDRRFLDELSFGAAFTALVSFSAPWLWLGVGLEWLRRIAEPALTGGGDSPLKARSIFPFLIVSAALLGWQWGLWMLVGIFWMAGAARFGSPKPDRSVARKAGTVPTVDLRRTWAGFEQSLHHHGVWMWLGALVVALMEPLVRVEIGGLGSGFAFAVSAFLGFAFCRNPLFGSMLAYFWLHTGWTTELVATFLIFGTARWMLGGSWILPRCRSSAVTAAFVGGGALALVWAAGFLPPQGWVEFHGLAETSTNPWWTTTLQVLALGGLATAFAVRLFAGGFRAFLRPIVDPAAEMTRNP